MDKIDRMIYQNKSVKPTEYYYGKQACYFRFMNYECMLEVKIKLGKKLKKELMKQDDWLDNKRIDDVQEAIDYNTALLKELTECVKAQNKGE